jgi:hypothetical protein
MRTLPLNYRARRGKRDIATIGDVKVSLTTDVVWKAGEGPNRTTVWHYHITGQVFEKGMSYMADWQIPVTEDDFDAIAGALMMLHEAADGWESMQNPPIEREVHAAVTPALRMGLIYHGAKFSHAYTEFVKGDQSLRATFEHLPAMGSLRRTS